MQETPSSFRLTPVSYLVLLLLAVAWPMTSFYFLQSQLDLASEITDPLRQIYYPTIIIQLVIALLVLFAVRSEQTDLADVGLGGFTRFTVWQGVGFYLIANAILAVLQLAIFAEAPGSFAEVDALLPKTLLERLVWVVLCAVVAVSEELTFRGYLISRVSRLAGGRVWVGVLVATLAFASGHLYQGLGGVFLIFVYGLMFAGLYLYTGSLYACIIAHFIQNVGVLLVSHFQ